jgi:hypothetical protein
MNEIQKAMKSRYPDLHPLIFHRSLEKAKTDGELFDLLEGMPKEFPIVWDEDRRSWVKTDNLLQALIKKKD